MLGAFVCGPAFVCRPPARAGGLPRRRLYDESVTKVVIVGAGKGGRALLEMFAGDPTVVILGVTDLNPWAPGIELARRLNVPVATELRELVAHPRADLIIDVTGSPEVHRQLQELKTPTAEVIGGIGARFMWDLL